MKLAMSLATLLVLSSTAQAQTMPIPTAYVLSMYFEATPTGTPISTFEFSKSATQCDLAPAVVPAGVIPNPRYLMFTDPERPTRECRFDTGAASGPLFAMPFGGRYVARLTGKVVVGGIDFLSEPSEISNPFVRGAAPAKPGAVRTGR